MSDPEEPPTKMAKYTDLQYLDEDCEDMLDEGQEEWLSEGDLTDGEYTVENELSESLIQEGNQSMMDLNGDATTTSVGSKTNFEDSKTTHNVTKGLSVQSTEQDIEDTLNNLNSDDKNENGVNIDPFDALLIGRNTTDSQLDNVKLRQENVDKLNQMEGDEDDGNDTDDLLRMLGEDCNNMKKKSLKMVKCERNEEGSTDDDDEFIYERSNMKTLKLAKNALISRQQASKAEPEDMTDSDLSSDEARTVTKMFGVSRRPDVKSKSSSKNVETSAGDARHRSNRKPIVKHVVHINSSTPKTETPAQKLTRQYTQKPYQTKSILKPLTPACKTRVDSKTTLKSVAIKTPEPFKPIEGTNPKTEKVFKSDPSNLEQEEGIDMEYLEDECLDEEELEGSEADDSKLRLRNPERMDEEIPSDVDSHTEDGSLYDELPSSESEDIEDWFALDIRAERAGDYLPLLGSKAHELLMAERVRAEARVATLRESLSALTESARHQAEELRAAAMALAEIDDTLRAA